MPDESPEPPVGALLRAADYTLPPTALADLVQGHALLQAMLARLASPAPTAEPATTFRPGAGR